MVAACRLIVKKCLGLETQHVLSPIGYYDVGGGGGSGGSCVDGHHFHDIVE